MSKRGTFLIALGSLCLVAALCLTGYNIWDEQRAARAAEDGVAALQEMIPDRQESEQLILPEEQPVMTTLKWANLDYIGVLEIPALFILNALFPLYGLAYAQCITEMVLCVAAIVVLARLFRKLEQRYQKKGTDPRPDPRPDFEPEER